MYNFYTVRNCDRLTLTSEAIFNCPLEHNNDQVLFRCFFAHVFLYVFTDEIVPLRPGLAKRSSSCLSFRTSCCRGGSLDAISDFFARLRG